MEVAFGCQTPSMTPAQRLIGPVTPPDLEGVAFIDHGDRLELRAERDLTGVATKDFADPAIAAVIDPRTFTGPDISLIGFAFTQFALPVRTTTAGRFDFAPSNNLTSPSAVVPLVLQSSDGRCELLAPMNAWHEQILAVDQGERIDRFRWGWHGDLDDIPAGFCAELGIFTGTSITDVFERWASAIGANDRPPARTDPLLTHLSYWTDNGAAYWYRTEPDRDLPTTLVDKIDELDGLGVPVRSVELDSWFYHHEISRPVATIGYLEEVPPTGMLSWTPRADVLPDGVAALRSRFGSAPGDDDVRPLVLHSRHISPTSPYIQDGDWWLGRAAHPVDPSFFRQWFDDAASWGATCIEQDWMMVVFFGTRALRSTPGRAMAWQRALDDAAAATGVSLMWCMALPGDFAASVELDHVIAIRTSDDYRYADDPADLWVWYLTVNRMAAALGLPVFKDCFLSSPDPGDSEIDGDPHAELEALLSALSAGVVGIGDRIGRTDVGIVRRTCRADGLLVGPDHPIALIDRSFADAGLDGRHLCWASAASGPWVYVVAINTADDPVTVADEVTLDHVGISEPCVVYDWRQRRASPATSIDVTLEPRDWALFVCCPIRFVDGEQTALIGDPDVYATMGRARVDHETETILIAEGEVERSPLRWTATRGLHT